MSAGAGEIWGDWGRTSIKLLNNGVLLVIWMVGSTVTHNKVGNFLVLGKHASPDHAKVECCCTLCANGTRSLYFFDFSQTILRTLEKVTIIL